jgi:hypothetical protein
VRRIFLLLATILLASLPAFGQAQNFPNGTGSTTVSAIAGNANAFYLQPTCPLPYVSGNCFPLFADTQQDVTCSVAATTNLTCSDAPFTAADVGKNVAVFNTCKTNSNSYISEVGTTTTTITVFNSATSVTMSQAATGTQASTACAWWGHPDDTGASLVDTALAGAITYCPAVILPAHLMWMATPQHFSTQPAGCAANGMVSGGSFGSNVLVVQGYGSAVSLVFVPPTYFASPSLSMFSIPPSGTFLNWGITGGGSPGTGSSSANVALVSIGAYAGMENFNCFNAGNNVTNLEGIHGVQSPRVRNVDMDACGSIGGHSANGGVVEFSTFADHKTTQFEDDSTAPFSMSIHDSALDGGPLTVASSYFLLKKGTGQLVLTNDDYNVNGATNIVETAIGCTTTATCPIVVQNNVFNMSTGSGNNSNAGISCAVACNVWVSGSKFSSQSAGAAFNGTITGVNFFDMGGNTISAGFPSALVSGDSIIAGGHELAGACTGTTLAAGGTLGLYGTGPNVSLTTCQAPTPGTGVPMTGPRTLLNLVVSAGTGGSGVGSGVVTVLKNGSTTTITCTIGTGTFCTDGTHTVTAVAGDLISIQYTAAASDTLANIKAAVEWN